MKRRSFFALPAALCALTEAPAAPPAARPFQLGCVPYNVLKDTDLDTILKTLDAAGAGERGGDSGRGEASESRRVLELESDRPRERFGEGSVQPVGQADPWREFFGRLRASGYKQWTLWEQLTA
jgi:hypothetical protein